MHAFLRQFAIAMTFITASLFGTEQHMHFTSSPCLHYESVAYDGCYDHHVYRHHRRQLDLDGDINDPTARLDDDTSWPGKREDFSDALFR